MLKPLNLSEDDRLPIQDPVDVQPRSDYKLDKLGRKIKAGKIKFMHGDDDGKSRVSEAAGIGTMTAGLEPMDTCMPGPSVGLSGTVTTASLLRKKNKDAKPSRVKEENMKKTYKQFKEQYDCDLIPQDIFEQQLAEVLSKDASAGEWISDFIKSDNPKFAGKSREKRKQMALAAYYAKQRNEEVDIQENYDVRKDPIYKEYDPEIHAIMHKDGKHKLVKHDQVNKAKTQGWKMRSSLKAFVKGQQQNESFIAESTAEHHEHMADQHSHHAIQHEKEVTNGGHDDHDYAATSHAEAEKAHRAAAAAHKKHGAESSEYKSAAAHAKSATANAKFDSSHIKFKKVAKPHPISESAFDWKNKPRQTSDKTTTMTAHDVKKTSTGTVYTKQRDADGMSKEFKRDPNAAKRGRGRPKKNAFGEAVEFLMALDEETFDSLMEEGFDSFMEHYEQLDELSKSTLVSYVKKANTSTATHGVNLGHAIAKGKGTPSADKIAKRIKGVDRASDRLAK